MNKKSGMILAEVLVGASILVVFISSLVLAQQTFLNQSSKSIERVQSALLAEEGIEAIKHLRDKSWSLYFGPESNGTHNLIWDNDWSTSSTPEIIDDKFYRNFTIENGLRNNFNIVESGGTSDPNTKKITVNISWLYKDATTTRTMSTYITNIHE
jgi:hypothetical protein